MLNKLNKDRFLTVRWNNLLKVIVGLPALIFVIVALSTSGLSDRTTFIVFFVLGAVY